MHVSELAKTKGYIYVASPYSKYPYGREAACSFICAISARLIENKLPIFSPIAHSHAIAEEGQLDPYSHDIWLPVCQPMIDAASVMLVVHMEGWHDSIGMRFEIDAFERANKPIWHLDPYSFLIWSHAEEIAHAA